MTRKDLVASALLAISFVTAAWNWFLRPERAVVWAAILVMLVAMAVILAVASRRWSAGPRRQAAESIKNSVVFAALIMALSLTGKVVVALGVSGDPDFSKRITMIIMGIFVAFTGNAIPKTLTPLAALQCDPARVQAFQRFAGWTWVLTGLGYAVAWLSLPVAIAQPVAMTVLLGGMLLVAVQVVRLRWMRPAGGQR